MCFEILEHIRKVSYLSIDMNCVKPEIAAAQFFWDRMVSGGIMVLDDYGFRGHIEQKRDSTNSQEKEMLRYYPSRQDRE